MAEIEKVIDGLYRLKSNMEIMCSCINGNYYNNSTNAVDDAIQTIRELQKKNFKIKKFIEDYDGAIIISENMGIVSGQTLIDELKRVVE